MLLTLLLACQPPPEEGLTTLRSGDLRGAAAQLSRADPAGALGDLKLLADRYLLLEPSRAAIHAVEGRMLRDAVDEALRTGELAKGARVLGAAVGATPDDAELRILAGRLEAAAAGAPDADKAVIYAVLADAAQADVDRSLRLRALARQAALRARYEPAALADTRAGQAGITREGAEKLLARVDKEYFVAPDWGSATVAGAEAADWLAQAPGALAAWPGLADFSARPMMIRDLDGALVALDAVLAAGAEVGVPEEVLIDEWVGGTLAWLDPWTRAVWPAELRSWEEGHAGVSEDVGLELEQAPRGGIRVARPLPGTWAWDSGIHQGDWLLRIADGDGEIVLDEVEEDRRLSVARAALKGPSGSKLQVTLQRKKGPEQSYLLVRGPVVEETVFGWSRHLDNSWNPWLDVDAGLAYARVTRFTPETEEAFDELLERYAGEIRGVLLDLRHNPGGDIDSAVQIADRFVADGWLVVLSGRVLPETSRAGADDAALAEWNQAVPGHAFEGTPVVVLVDTETASAAEVLAGSLQELARAPVVGAPTWGKGYAQVLRSSPAWGYGVQITNVVWTLPSGRRLVRNIPGGGAIDPDVTIALSPAEGFLAERIFEARTTIKAHYDGTPIDWPDPGRREDLPDLPEDPQIVAGELVLRSLLR